MTMKLCVGTVTDDDGDLREHINALGDRAIEVEVLATREEAPGILAIRLGAVGAGALPKWRPGAHIDVATPAGLRQYSLCGVVNCADEWTIGVLDEPGGRGGSRWLHAQAREGVRLWVSEPRDTFKFEPCGEVLLIAGGIGITPLVPMAETLAAEGAQWRLLYTVREEGTHAFGGRFDERAQLWTSSTNGRLPIRSELGAISAECVVYCCGPETLVDEVAKIADELGIGSRLRTERFTSDAPALREDDTAFTVTMQRSGKDIEVPANMTLLERLGQEGAFVVSSCHAGICGSCETPMLAGEADHRDQVLTDDEKAVNDCIFPCVSRARAGQRLVLDI